MKQFLLIVMTFGLLLQTSLVFADQKTTGAELIGGDFNLTDHTGKRVTLKSYSGKYLLVFFGFSHCPGVCPLGLRTIVSSLTQVGSLANEIQPIFISVDPARDTQEVLAKYVKSFGSLLVGLRGSEKELAEVVGRYRAYYQKLSVPKDQPKESYLMDHSPIIYLMNKSGKYISHFSSAEGAKKISEKIKLAITVP